MITIRRTREDFVPARLARRLLLILPLSCVVFLCLRRVSPADRPGSPPEFDAGFLASRDTNVHGYRRARALGPFLEWQSAEDGRTFVAVRPFFSHISDPKDSRSLSEFLWPVGKVKHVRNETSWRFLTAYGNNFDDTDPDSRFRFVVFPVFFTGRDKHKEKYVAIFPLGGKINEFLGRDSVVFMLFPLYARSSVNDVDTRDVLWPLISWTRGDESRRLRVFPLYGKSVNGESWTKKFVVWPVWTSARYGYPESSGSGFILFPFFGHFKLTDQESWLIVPPLFRLTRSDDHTAVTCPWPFFQYSSGNVDKLYIWPVWGRKSFPGTGAGSSVERTRSSFFLWPIVRSYRVDREDYVLKRLLVLPVIYYERRITKADGRKGNGLSVLPEPEPEPGGKPMVGAARTGQGLSRVSAVCFKLWPLMSYRREGDATRTRLLDLWPIRDMSCIEKNLAPLWTLYSGCRVGKMREDELFWGLFRWRRGGDGDGTVSLFPLFSWQRLTGNGRSRRWSLLLGLAGYEREGLRRSYRLLYFLKWETGVGVKK